MSEVLQPFPENGHSLIVSGIGPKGSAHALSFIEALAACSGLSEVLGVSLTGTSVEVKQRIGGLLTPKKQVVPPWRTLFKRPAEKALLPSPVILNDTTAAADALTVASRQYGDSARLVLHFISYEFGPNSKITDTIADFNSYMRGLDQFGVIMVPPDNIVERFNFERASKLLPPESLGIPVILQDHQPDEKIDLSARILTPDKALTVGLAGLVANKKTLPGLNSTNYLASLHTLSSQSGVTGVAIYETALFSADQTRQNLPRQVNSSIQYSAEMSMAGFTSLPPKGKAADIVTVQIPIPSTDRYWVNTERIEELRKLQAEQTNALRRSMLSFGYLNVPPTGKFDQVPMITTRLFPAEKDFIKDFLEEVIKKFDK